MNNTDYATAISVLLILMFCALAVMSIPALVWIYLRRRARRCSHCGRQMDRIPTDEALARLTPAQKTEIAIGSSRHDYYRCNSCGSTKLLSKLKWFSGFTACPSCKAHAVKRSTKVITPASQISTGKSLVLWDCMHCHQHREANMVIPQQSTSDSTFPAHTAFDPSWSAPSSPSPSSFDSSPPSSPSSDSGGGASGSW